MSDFSMQIELWKQCNNFCDFCYLGEQNKYTSEEVKLQNIEKAHNIIDSHFLKDSEQIKAIGFLGGEFFQGQLNTPRVRDSFYKLCKKCFCLINEDKVRDFWCYCTLTIGDQKDLYDLIDLFDKIVIDKEKHHFWVQVSFDVTGRFNKPGKFENWDYHLRNLQKYSFIKFNVTTILTEDFIQSVLTNKINLKEFQKKYKNTFFFKQPNSGNGKTKDKTKEEYSKNHLNFFPKRKSFLQFLRKVKMEDLDLFNEILNINLRSNEMFNCLESQISDKEIKPQVRNKDTWEEDNLEINPKCNHIDLYQCYIDSDACCLCDYMKIKEEVD